MNFLPIDHPPFAARSRSRRMPNPMLQWSEAVIAADGASLGEDPELLLSDGRRVRQAASCLLRPEPGDLVAIAECSQGAFVTAVLARAQLADGAARMRTACLTVPGAPELALEQARIRMRATQTIDLASGGDVQLTAGRGAVAMQAEHLLATATGTLVQQAEHLVTRGEHCTIEARALLRVHGQNAMLTASDDIKLDAERISLG